MGSLRLAYSPCPNDTYIFHAWVHGLVPDAPPVEERLEDIETLNRIALRGDADVIKVSLHAYAHLRETHALLHAGGALGRGCGPLLVARKDSWLRPAPSVRRVATLVDHLSRVRVAVPGELTTGALLLGLFSGGTVETLAMPFDRIMRAIVQGDVEAGVIIHEGRFTYGPYGLRRLVDLGEWWEDATELPLPLGAIAVSRSLGVDMMAAVEGAVRGSVEHAFANPGISLEYVRENAQEMDPAVCMAHIDLYVNEFTRDYGSEGEEAIRRLLETAAEFGVVPRSDKGLFWDG